MSQVPVLTIPDIQSSPDSREIAINKVGIKGIRHPIQFIDKSNTPQNTVAEISMYVNLPATQKGTHMSRFVEIINNHTDTMTVAAFSELLHRMVERLEAPNGYIEMHFPYFVNKKAPISGVQSLLDYDVALIGMIEGDTPVMQVRVLVPVTSLCPCSKEISQYGAHNQRSHVTITATLKDFIWVEELIELIETEASCQLYGLLKRPDEKYVTEHAYDNPKFVEDMVRDLALKLNQDERISAYSVESENFESIHNHSAYAVIEYNKEGL